jgi:hypothetical protein
MNNDEDDLWDNREYPTAEEFELESAQADDLYEDEESEDEEFYEDFDEDILNFDDEDGNESNQQSLVDRARVRLEQGRLYEMLLGHNLFEGVEASPEAIDNVQRELKEYIMERLEILLGMRNEKEEAETIVQESPFNDLEVQALKIIANKVTKGASATAPTTPAVPEPSLLNTVKQKLPKKTLNTLGAKTQDKFKNKKELRKTPKEPTPAGKKLRRRIKKEMAETGTENMTAKAAAKKDMKYIDSLKKMSLEEANEVVSQRHSRPTPKKEISQEMVNNHYQTRASIENTKINDYTKVLRMVAMQKANAKD